MRARGFLAVAAAMIGCGSQSSSQAVSASTGAPTLDIHVVGGGQVTGSFGSCSADCHETFAGSSPTDTLAAHPNAGFSFGGWQGACSGTADCTVALNGAPSITAVFDEIPAAQPSVHRLTITLSGAAAGRVTSSPAGIDCPGTCGMTVPDGTAVALSAAAAAGDLFDGWSGACVGVVSCSVTLHDDASVDARFQIPPACVGPISLPPSHGVTADTNRPDCFPGITDPAGTLALIADGDIVRGLAFYDAASANVLGGLATFTNGSSAQYAATPSGFLQFVRTPIGPGGATLENLAITPIDHQGKAGAQAQVLQERMSMGAGPAGGVVLAGDLLVIDAATNTSAVRHELCVVSPAAMLSCSERQAAGPVYGVGVDMENRALVITGGAAKGSITAQWFDGNARALTNEFVLLSKFTAGPNTWFEGRALLDGTLAVRRVDQQDDASGHPYRTAQWLLTASAGTSSARPAPAWLVSRPDMDLAFARQNAAYAMLPMGKPSAACTQTVELLARDGTACGSVSLPIASASGTCRTEDVVLGADGTLVEVIPRDLRGDTCEWVFWGGALR